jgi:thymidylate kinase
MRIARRARATSTGPILCAIAAGGFVWRHDRAELFAGHSGTVCHSFPVPTLVTITGPIAAGKNTVADLLAEHCVSTGRTVVIADVDDVALMVGLPGAAEAGLWLAAHQAHGALVGQWMQSNADVVISVGPVYSQAERDALFGQLPPTAQPIRVLIDAPLSVTWQRVTADESRVVSRQRDFHEYAHARYRSHMPDIPTDLSFNSGDTDASEIAGTILRAAGIDDRRVSPSM